MAFAGECLTRRCAECPSGGVASSLSDIVETGALPLRHYLTPRACMGILRRARERGKPIPDPLRKALEATIARAGMESEPVEATPAEGGGPIPLDTRNAGRDPAVRAGCGIGQEGDPAYTVTSSNPQAVCVETPINDEGAAGAAPGTTKEQGMEEQETATERKQEQAPWSVEGLSMEGQEVTVRLRINSPADLAALLAALTREVA